MSGRFGELLKRWRVRANKSMGDVARHLGVSVTYVSDVERGVRTPFVLEKIMLVAQFLDIPPMETVELFHASAEWRGAYELNAGVTKKHNDVAAGLMSRWTSLTEKQLHDIDEIVSRRKTGEHAPVTCEERH